MTRKTKKSTPSLPGRIMEGRIDNATMRYELRVAYKKGRTTILSAPYRAFLAGGFHRKAVLLTVDEAENAVGMREVSELPERLQDLLEEAWRRAYLRDSPLPKVDYAEGWDARPTESGGWTVAAERPWSKEEAWAVPS